MSDVHTKNHDGWNILKKQLDCQISPKPIYFNEREVWFCSIGHNVGGEEDGKGYDYSRPVVIIRRFGPNLFIGIPLTTQIRSEKYCFGIGDIKGKAAMAIISQIRLFSSKRLVNKIDVLPQTVFIALKKATKNFIF